MKGRLPRPRAIDRPEKIHRRNRPRQGRAGRPAKQGKAGRDWPSSPVPGSVMTATTSRTPLSRKSPNNRSPAWKTHDRNPAARPTCRTHSIWKPSGTTRAAKPSSPACAGKGSRAAPCTPGPIPGKTTGCIWSAPPAACSCSPWRGRIREFDFTVFRPAFPLAVPLARAAFRWVFRHTETSALWGLCPVSNRHAWRLATACGFVITGRLPAACWLARRGVHVDGIQLLCTPETLARAIKMSPSGHRAHP